MAGELKVIRVKAGDVPNCGEHQQSGKSECFAVELIERASKAAQ